MYNIQIDLVKQCGECDKYHYVIYKWNGQIRENIYSATAKTPEECFSEGLIKYNRIIQNES